MFTSFYVLDYLGLRPRGSISAGASFMKASLVKQALFVERLGGPLNDLSGNLEPFGYEAVRAAEPQAVEGLIRSLRRLSLIVVNGETLKTDASTLLGAMRGQRPEVPVVWFGVAPKPARNDVKPPDFVTQNMKELGERIVRQIGEEFYPQSFVSQIVSGTQKVLGGFELPTRALDPVIRSGATVLSELNALLFFSSERLAGHVLLGASATDLAKGARSASGKGRASEDELEDLLGEVANQVAGQVKRCLGANAAEYRLGLPYFVRGTAATFRHKAACPSLAIIFANGPQRLNFELSLQSLDGASLSLGRPENHLSAGELNFL